MVVDLESLKDEYLSKQSYYNEFKDLICQKIGSFRDETGINFEIQSRVKNVESFLKKVLKKNYSDPWVEIKDLIGIRIIAPYESEILKIDEIIRQRFKIHSRENKLHSLEYNQLGYLGIHFEVSLLEIENKEEQYYAEGICEIQLHTQAQNLWATISHQLSYKPLKKPQTEIRRSIYRLIALIELFDKEVSNVQEVILDQPDFPEAKILKQLEKHFCVFLNKEFDREFSMQNIAVLKVLLRDEDIDDFDEIIDAFIEDNRQKLSSIFRQYSEDQRDSYKILMLLQPESLLIFERLDKNRFELIELWKDFLPLELLSFLANVWGTSLPSS